MNELTIQFLQISIRLSTESILVVISLLKFSLVAIFIDLTSDFVVQVQAAVDNLRASAAQRTSCLETEMSTAHNSSSSVKEQWKTHMEETEAHYVEDIEAIETGKLGLDDGFRNW